MILDLSNQAEYEGTRKPGRQWLPGRGGGDRPGGSGTSLRARWQVEQWQQQNEEMGQAAASSSRRLGGA
jgi:hypothetical protein